MLKPCGALPDGAVVKTVRLRFYRDGSLMGMWFYNSNDNQIFECGYHDRPECPSYHYHPDIVLADDERIIGYKAGDRGRKNGMLFDF